MLKEKSFPQILFVLLFPVLLFGLLGPLEIYSGNVSEFKFTINDYYWYLVIASLIFLVIMSIVLCLLPKKISDVLCTIIFIGSLLCYLQNMFLNKDLMQADGSAMVWSEYKTLTVVNLIIWLVSLAILVALAIGLKQKWNKVMLYGSASLSLIQLVAWLSLFVPLVVNSKPIDYMILSGEDEFKVSSGENVLVLVLDRYANGQLEGVLEKHPDLLTGMEDFTYYDNAGSCYNYTFPSLAYMLTGYKVDTSVTASDWLSLAWTSDRAENFYNILHSRNFKCGMYTISDPHIFRDANDLYGKLDNIKSSEVSIDRPVLSRLFLKMTIYKYVPYIMKPRFEVLTYKFGTQVHYLSCQPSVEDNGEFYNYLIENGLQLDETSENSFKVIHLDGIHNPYTIGSDGYPVLENETNQENVQLGLSVIINEYLNQLKELGVYDDATIIVTADHGLFAKYYDPQPIYFIKQKGEHHETMQINHAPISTEDFQATVLTCIGETSDDFGSSIFDIDENKKRTRFTAFPSDEVSGFNVFTYEGGREELISLMKNGAFELISGEGW